MVEELKELIKIQDNLRSYKTVPFPAVWEGFITELSQKGTVEPTPPYGQLVYNIYASKVSRNIATGIGYCETKLDMRIYDLDGTRLYSVLGGGPAAIGGVWWPGLPGALGGGLALCSHSVWV